MGLHSGGRLTNADQSVRLGGAGDLLDPELSLGVWRCQMSLKPPVFTTPSVVGSVRKTLGSGVEEQLRREVPLRDVRRRILAILRDWSFACHRLPPPVSTDRQSQVDRRIHEATLALSGLFGRMFPDLRLDERPTQDPKHGFLCFYSENYR